MKLDSSEARKSVALTESRVLCQAKSGRRKSVIEVIEYFGILGKGGSREES